MGWGWRCGGGTKAKCFMITLGCKYNNKSLQTHTDHSEKQWGFVTTPTFDGMKKAEKSS